LVLTAKARDNVGTTAVSSPVSITVNPQPVISVTDVVVPENITNAVFNLNLSGAVCVTVTVDVLTADGTALAAGTIPLSL